MLDGVLTWLDGNWFTLLIALFLTGAMLYGHSRGFLRLFVSLAAVLITVILTRLALPPVTAFINENTGIQRSLESYIIKVTGVDALNADAFGTTEAQEAVIDSLAIPEGLKKGLKENNTGEIWEKLGAERFPQFVADYVSRTVLHLILLIVIFVVIWILLRVLMNVMDIFTKLPVIHGLNQIAGAVLGLAEGLFAVWAFFIILSLFSGSAAGSKLMDLINTNVWLRFLYQYNMITWFLKAMLGALL